MAIWEHGAIIGLLQRLSTLQLRPGGFIVQCAACTLAITELALSKTECEDSHQAASPPLTLTFIYVVRPNKIMARKREIVTAKSGT